MFDRTYRSLGLCAAAFESDGTVYYAIFEAVELNQCELHECAAFGTFPTIIAWLFAAMARCEAGFTLDVDGRHYDPAIYYQRVMDALRNPKRLFDQPIFLDAGSGPEGSIPRSSDIYYHGDMLPWAADALSRHGLDTVLQKLKANRVAVLSLHQHAKVLAAIFGYDASHRHVAPWRAIEPQGEGLNDSCLAPRHNAGPRLGRIKPPRWIDLGTGALTALCAPGVPSMVGDRTDVVCQYMARIALRYELVCTGWGLDAIQVVRDRLSKSPEWPDGEACMLAINRRAARGMVRFTPIINRILDTLRGQAVLDGELIRAPLSLFRDRGLVSVLPDLSFALDVQMAGTARNHSQRAA